MVILHFKFNIVTCKMFANNIINNTNLKTDPQVLSHTAHLEDTGKFPSIH